MKLLRHLLNEVLYWTFLIDRRSWSRNQPHVDWGAAGLQDDDTPRPVRQASQTQ